MKPVKKTHDTIIGMFKFGSEENIIDLLENGTMYLNSIQYFKTVEDAELRGDKYEGITEILNFPNGEFEIPALNFKGQYISIHLKNSFQEVTGNIYSLYCISSFHITNPIGFKIDGRVVNFGKYCLVINDLQIFLDRVKRALQQLGLKYTIDFVSYYDKSKKNGKVTLFEKSNEFSYQNEFRIYVPSNSTDAMILNIGSMADIAQIVPVSDILESEVISNKA
jgi:hypothetical protein